MPAGSRTTTAECCQLTTVAVLPKILTYNCANENKKTHGNLFVPWCASAANYVPPTMWLSLTVPQAPRLLPARDTARLSPEAGPMSGLGVADSSGRGKATDAVEVWLPSRRRTAIALEPWPGAMRHTICVRPNQQQDAMKAVEPAEMDDGRNSTMVHLRMTPLGGSTTGVKATCRTRWCSTLVWTVAH